jgi:hypothetical protein
LIWKRSAGSFDSSSTYLYTLKDKNIPLHLSISEKQAWRARRV